MPSRLLREGILDSDAVNALSFPAEVFYRRLMSVVDDFGRFDGRTAVLKGRLYALKPTVRESDITHWIAECEKAGLILLYRVDSKPYILFRKLGPARAKESRYPHPPTGVAEDRGGNLFSLVNGCNQAFTDENIRLQVKSDVPYSDSDSDSGSDAVDDAVASSCPEPDEPAPGPPVMTFDCVGQGEKDWALTEAKLAEWVATFPGVDVLAELRKARQWLIDNPSRRKTGRGMTKFLGGWLGRVQDRGLPTPHRPVPPDRKAAERAAILDAAKRKAG